MTTHVYAFHHYIICPEDICTFTYIVPPIHIDLEPLLFINLVLLMGWVNSPDLFCTTSKTVIDKANAALSSGLKLDTPYLPMDGLYHLPPSPSVCPTRLQYIYVYMDNINCLTQEDQSQQHCFTEIVLRALKSMYPSIPGEMKDSISLKKAVTGDGD